MKITHYITILLLSLLLFNCKGQEDTQILHAESCLDKDPSESFKILQNIDANELSPMNRALYALIKTEALYKCDIPAESDSNKHRLKPLQIWKKAYSIHDFQRHC